MARTNSVVLMAVLAGALFGCEEKKEDATKDADDSDAKPTATAAAEAPKAETPEPEAKAAGDDGDTAGDEAADKPGGAPTTTVKNGAKEVKVSGGNVDLKNEKGTGSIKDGKVTGKSGKSVTIPGL